ncbi:hypothetical protein [Pararhizobium sp. LjRoot238]|uniref:hypothetical protein n=1 Tax=Pararhizobium sp. LjRoot238 TaxID=3342293 RepID=UPI003ED10474
MPPGSSHFAASSLLLNFVITHFATSSSKGPNASPENSRREKFAQALAKGKTLGNIRIAARRQTRLLDFDRPSANHPRMTATTDFIAELFRAANEVGKLTVDEKRRLMKRGMRTIRELRLETGIRPSRTGRDALLAIQIDALQTEARSDDEIRAVLLDLADMIRTLKIVLDVKA